MLTDAASEVVERVRRQRGADLSLVIGNGCCDSTAPFLFAGYIGGPNELEVTTIDGLRVLVDRTVAPSVEGREVVVDVSEGDVQPDSFSCEAELGVRFSLDRLPAL